MSILSELTTAANGAAEKLLKDRSELQSLVPSKEEVAAAQVAIKNLNTIISEPPFVTPQ